jgi:ArsR family transcriptional regulator
MIIYASMRSDHARDEIAIRVARALADPTRFRLFREIVAHGEICCRDLTTRLGVTQATVSHHLRILSDAGLVASRRAGQFSYFRGRAETVREHTRALGSAFVRRERPRRAG